MKPEDWPRLSEALPARHTEPGFCSNCGANGTRPGQGLTLWQEHDHLDQSELRFVWLCHNCTEELIEPHVRLYRMLDKNAPAPGAMAICQDCTHRRRCFCPQVKANGGPGILITAPRPVHAFVDGTRGGRRTGWRMAFYNSPPTACTGKICLPTP